jgi:hypothetical protein
MASWGLVVFAIGLAYGFLTHGRQGKWKLFKKGLLLGFVLAIVLWVVGLLLKSDPIGLGTGPVGIFVSVIVLTLLFILGVWLGDLLERVFRK